MYTRTEKSQYYIGVTKILPRDTKELSVCRPIEVALLCLSWENRYAAGYSPSDAGDAGSLGSGKREPDRRMESSVAPRKEANPRKRESLAARSRAAHEPQRSPLFLLAVESGGHLWNTPQKRTLFGNSTTLWKVYSRRMKSSFSTFWACPVSPTAKKERKKIFGAMGIGERDILSRFLQSVPRNFPLSQKNKTVQGRPLLLYPEIT
ncbi:MAG: hypothetical protein IJU76_14785 [Desulfovibrionaceae bacterium]|nr:hypothetical protein [Desulfovibrionaceae bacterium]